MKIENIFKELPTLYTKSLMLRKITLEDAQDIFEYSKDPEVTRFVTWEPHKKDNEKIMGSGFTTSHFFLLFSFYIL